MSPPALGEPLLDYLRVRRVRVDTPDPDTLVLHDVPVPRGLFNKPRTSLLAKRPAAAQPYLVCVDADLVYAGPDPVRRRAFRFGTEREGWRVLFLERGLGTDLQAAVAQGLRVLGLDTPTTAPAADESLLARVGRPLLAPAEGGADAEPVVGREREMAAVLSCLLRQGPTRLAVVAGDAGVGKTHLVRAAARHLAAQGRPLAWIEVDLARATSGTIFNAEKEALLRSLLEEAAARPDTVLVLEQMGGACTHMPAARPLLAAALEDGLRAVGTTLPGTRGWFRAEPLARRIQIVRLQEPAPADAAAIVEAWRERLARHHGVAIDASLLPLTLRLSAPLSGVQPAKALTLLDEAAASARLAEATLVSPDDLSAAAGRLEETAADGDG